VEDRAASQRARAFLAKQWSDFDLHPRSETVLCTPEVCREHVAFEQLSSVYRMAQIPKDDGVEVVSGSPEPGPDGTFSIVVYWAQPGSQLSDVPKDVVRR